MSLLTRVMIAPTVRHSSCNNSHVADLGYRLAGIAEAMLYLETGCARSKIIIDMADTAT